jgi:pimeloyl-ACP methyl ester carboxylesterase
LDLAYEEHGPSGGDVVVLLHGFPYDPRCFDSMAPSLAAEGCRVIVPYLRGYGPTRFVSPTAMRSGQQAALARGQAGLAANRRELARLLWRLWSPSWRFDDTAHAQTAQSFENPDFVAVVVHSYRHRYGYAGGDPTLDAIEDALAKKPRIRVPTISLCGADDGVSPPPPEDTDAGCFTGRYERRVLPGIGHNIPQEAPVATQSALLDLLRG